MHAGPGEASTKAPQGIRRQSFRVKGTQDRVNIMQDKSLVLVWVLMRGTEGQERIKTIAATKTELLSHRLPHVRLWQAGDRELLYTSVSLWACWSALHVCVVVSPHRRGWLRRTTQSFLEPLLSVCCVCLVVVHPSHH